MFATARITRSHTPRRIGLGLGAAGLALAGSLVYAPSAQATTTYWTVYDHCGSGGFTGTVRVKDYTTSSTKMRLTEVAYKINKGKNKGGNSANVDFIDMVSKDGGGSPYYPDRREWSIDNAKQDGKYHVLPVPDHNRTRGAHVYVWFIFDKSHAFDPNCEVGWKL